MRRLTALLPISDQNVFKATNSLPSLSVFGLQKGLVVAISGIDHLIPTSV